MENSNFTTNIHSILFALRKLEIKIATNGTPNQFENLIGFNSLFSDASIFIVPKESLKLKLGVNWYLNKTEEFDKIQSNNPTILDLEDLHEMDIDLELTSKLEELLFKNNVHEFDLKFLYILELLVKEDLKLKFPKW